MSQTKGQYRVGSKFNPSGYTLVNDIKTRAAALIDLIESIPSDGAGGAPEGEVARLKALAQTDIETAAMHGVKAATKRPMGDA